MSVLDMLARAEVSSDLQHHDRDCDVDVLGAAGMAAATNVRHMAIFRLKYLNDASEIDAAKRLFIQWAGIDMRRRKLNQQGAARMGTQALTHWLNDICPACNGLKYQMIEGAPALSDKICSKCNGTGKNRLPYSGQELECVKDLHDRANAATATIQRGLWERMGKNNY